MKTSTVPLSVRPDVAIGLFLFLGSWAVAGATCADGPADGRAIYEKRCLSCHGKAGEGSQDYPHALIGDKSVKELSKSIAKTMPEDDPGTCVGEEADAVAAYIHDAFYSSIA